MTMGAYRGRDASASPDSTDEIRTTFPGITHRQISMLRFDSAGLAGVCERVISTLFSGQLRTSGSRHG
jgi:hypothetical protein